MKLKIFAITVIGTLLFVGAGCAGRGPLAQPKGPEAGAAATSNEVDKSVDDILKDESATTDVLSDESADSAEITADQADINSVQDTTYETE
jgi:hypothetical protein